MLIMNYLKNTNPYTPVTKYILQIFNQTPSNYKVKSLRPVLN